MLRAVIVEDEAPARRRLERLLAAAGIPVVGAAARVDEATTLIADVAPDVVFLDIQLDGETGFDLLARLPASGGPRIVFVTAHDEFAVKAFEHAAVDYILKPVSRDRLLRAIARLQREASSQRTEVLLERLEALVARGARPTAATPNAGTDRLALKDRGRTVLVRTSDIECLCADGNYVRVVTAKEEYLQRATLQELEAQLDPDRFVRAHRSLVLNLDRVREIHPWTNGDAVVVMLSGRRVRWSRTHREALERVLNRFNGR